MTSITGTLRSRLEKEKARLARVALREPRTKQELLDRWRWNRLNEILWRRYERKDL